MPDTSRDANSVLLKKTLLLFLFSILKRCSSKNNIYFQNRRIEFAIFKYSSRLYFFFAFNPFGGSDRLVVRLNFSKDG